MKKISNNLLLLATGATLGAIGYMAIKHPEKVKELATDAMAFGEKLLQQPQEKSKQSINQEEENE